MSAPRCRAWRFDHPDFDREHGSGLSIGASGRIDMVDTDAAVRQSVLMLLTTRPGERVMLPAYGCELDRLLFAPNDATTAGLAIHYVRRALLRWEQRIEILELDAAGHPQHAALLMIELKYRVRPTLNQQHLLLELALHGAADAPTQEDQ